MLRAWLLKETVWINFFVARFALLIVSIRVTWWERWIGFSAEWLGPYGVAGLKMEDDMGVSWAVGKGF